MESVLRQRAISAVIFVIIVISLFAIGQYGVLAILVTVLCGTLYEICRLDKFSTNTTIGIICTALAFSYILFELKSFQPNLLISLLILTCILYLILAIILISSSRSLYPIIKKSLFSYPILGFALAINILMVESVSIYLIFGTILLIWVCDSGAYLVGRKLGKHKLFERVSPKKTWEGIGGSLLFTLIASYPISLFLPHFPLSNWILIAICVVIFGTLGDLIQSKIKREFGVKDSGNLMPGHGGWWDRFDSFAFVLPFAFLIAYFC